MSLNGIDISDYQRGINLAAVPADFVIVKATQGTGYTSPSYEPQAAGTIGAGKLLGVYHYIGGGNATAEASYFVNAIRPYLGKAVLALDWESNQNSAWGDMGYLQQVASEVIRLTGVRPLLYGSQSAYNQLAQVGKALNCGLWVAQYATTDQITGYQATPWNEGAYACAVRQYSDNCLLPGYGVGVDCDKFYGDRNAWMKYAAVNGNAQPAPAPAPAQPAQPVDINDLATRTIRGEFGNGAQRQAALGPNYTTVMAEVNRRLGDTTRKSIQQIAAEVIAGQWGNDPQRSQKLRTAGYDPTAVQQIVNQLMGQGAGPAHSHTVRSGDTLSNITGISDWDRLCQIARANGIANPNRIYPGQTIRW